MTRFETPQVAVIGAGEIGRGWVALCVAAGWPVTLYEPDAEILNSAMDAITERVQALVDLKRADATVAEEALNGVVVGRSLLQAVGEAGWIIECLPRTCRRRSRHCTSRNRSPVVRQCSAAVRSASPPPTSGHGSSTPIGCWCCIHCPGRVHPLVEVAPSPRTDLKWWRTSVSGSACWAAPRSS